MRVQIGAGHPHAGEYGVTATDDQAARNAKARGGAPRNGTLVNLENCQHGVDCCYVFPGEYHESA